MRMIVPSVKERRVVNRLLVAFFRQRMASALQPRDR
jgi:hypothetical protein